ncbi:hypothetical protein LCI18_003999 [Fusarium solani-melongenae]|uniref:Uncharacterized protein n=1 Tax=Fusarium solani subsp. cucurbitae TaxID=2747967 RepID=A0ACD3YVP7_FUSSC|nr:hypothetical protein LCI18_003999 [Fusarium solani-melongenae]
MSTSRESRILIIGAGCAKVSFLVRPHRQQDLERPQLLYCYDDDQLKEYSDYFVITNPSAILEAAYDVIIVTLDGAVLQSQEGQSLVKTIGDAVRGTDTKVLLGGVFFDSRHWFLRCSGLKDDQVANGSLGFVAYGPQAVTLPIHPPTDENLLAKADVAYTDCTGAGFVLEDSIPSFSSSFAALYNRCGVSTCVVRPHMESALTIYPLFALFAAFELMGWPEFEDIDTNSPLWTLATAAFREIQALSVNGEAGRQGSQATTAEGLAGMLRGLGEKLLPLDLQAFFRYHHGGKVKNQDHMLLQGCISQGDSEGRPLPAVQKLLYAAEHDGAGL